MEYDIYFVIFLKKSKVTVGEVKVSAITKVLVSDMTIFFEISLAEFRPLI